MQNRKPRPRLFAQFDAVSLIGVILIVQAQTRARQAPTSLTSESRGSA